VLDAEDFVEKIEAERRAEGLHRPCGPAAVKLGIGPELPKRKVVRDADTDQIHPAPGDDPEAAGAPGKQRRRRTKAEWAETMAEAERPLSRDHDSRDLGDPSWASEPPDPPGEPPPADDLPF
jgi:hypothetical protein